METTDSQFDGTIESAVNGLLSPDLQETEVEEQDLEGEEVEETEVAEEAEESEEPEGDEDEPVALPDDYEDPEADEDAPAPPLYTVRVDGKEEEVTLEDLKQGYSGQKYVQKGMQEAAALRKEAEAVYANLLNERQQIGQALQLAQSGALQAPTPPDKSLQESDPIGYINANNAYQEEKAAWDSQMAMLQQQAAQQSQAEQVAQRAYLQREMETLQTLVPEFSEPVKAAETRDRLMVMGQEIYGYEPDEISAVMDHRAIRVLHDAIKYQELQSKSAEKVKAKPKRTVKPGAKKVASVKNDAKQGRQKLKKSGNIEDALSLILQS